MNLREILTNKVNGTTFITIDSETNVALRGGKSNPLQGRVVKRTTGSNVMVFQNKEVNGYDAMVRRRLAAEGKDPSSFELSERQWGVREHGTPFVTHKGSDYLEVIFLRCGTVEYLVDGVVTDKDMIAGLNLDKEEGDQGGLENKVIIRTFKFDSIRAITVDHVRYERR